MGSGAPQPHPPPMNSDYLTDALAPVSQQYRGRVIGRRVGRKIGAIAFLIVCGAFGAIIFTAADALIRHYVHY